MLRPRIIPCLLIHKGGLVKTTQFGDPKYVGDPLNAVRIFNEMEVDELMVIDIDKSALDATIDEKLIAEMAAECRMPLTYGGGIKSADQVERLIALGVEKVAISSGAFENPNLIAEAAVRVGSQSLVGVIDYKKAGLLRKSEVVTHNGKRRMGLDPVAFAENLQRMGVGEVVLNSVERDGKMEGYDIELAKAVRERIRVPLTVLGGAGHLDHMSQLVRSVPLAGAAAGSLFVFKGKYRAVLINYPSWEVREKMV
jgi:imidazole glycerol-phosphate synthase subunit HisF